MKNFTRQLETSTRHLTGGSSAAMHCTWGESLLVFGVLYGIFSTVIWGVCWLSKINYDPDLIAVAWAVPVLLDTLVNKAYDWNNEIRRWD